MPALTTSQRAAIAERSITRRDFVWIEARDLETGDPDPRGFWTGVGVVTVGGRDYVGAGVKGNATLSGGSDLAIPALALTLSGVSDAVLDAMRGTNVENAGVTFSIGLFDPQSEAIIDGLIDIFVGFVDTVEIKTPAPGQDGAIVVTCESVSRLLTVKGTDTRSDASQKLRSASDRFFEYAGEQRKQIVYFGRKAPRDTRR